MGIVYVSHRLPEVLDVADRVTVLRDGVSQGTLRGRRHVGGRRRGDDDRAAARARLSRDRCRPGRTRCCSRSPSSAAASSGRSTCRSDRGEIVGIAGAEGNGQVQFLRALAGVEPSNGTVTCAGKRVHLSTPPGAIRAGIILLSADRKQESIFTALSVRANATLQVLAQVRHGSASSAARASGPRSTQQVDRLRLKAASIEQPTQYLSGGNQQKVALMRPFLRGDLNVILADEPTQGVDVGARLDIYHALRDKAAEGTCVLVKSSDAIELAGICDRVVVMSRGDDRRRDPTRRTRRAADHRRHHRARIGTRRSQPWRMTDARVRRSRQSNLRPTFQLSRWLPIAAMMLLILVLGAYTNSAGLGVPVDVQPQRRADRHDAAGAGGDGADQRPDGQGVRRVGRRRDHVVRRGLVVRARWRELAVDDPRDAVRDRRSPSVSASST